MTLAELAIKITCDSKEAEKGIEQTEQKTSRLSTVVGKVSSGVKTAGKVIGTAVGASAVAIGKFGLNAVKVYSDYEQLVGGVETLFKESAPIVQKYAHDAFKTAGVDANTYMENVTSFAASLNQSLKGDTQAAAETANMAMIDMADNANKMGTSMESIQNAYRGFSKQNYTMLDNLKLGYGGTRKEMQRLLKDATKLTGKKYNLNNLKDVYEAIHVIQEELGITGTTAEEASTTIQGSLGMMKSAWTNLKIAIVSPDGNISQALSDFVESAKTFGKNAIPAFSDAIKGIGGVIKELAPVISSELPGLVSDILPDLINAAVELVGGLAKAIVDNAPMIIDGFGQIIQKIADVLKDSDSPILQAAGELIGFIGDIIRDPLGTLEKAWDTVWTGITTLASNIWEGIKSTASTVWEAIKGFWTENIAEPISKAWEKVKEAVSVVWEAIKKAASSVWNAIKDFWSQNIASPLSGVWEKVKEAISAVWESIKTAAQTAWNAVKKFVEDPIKAVSNTLSFIWNGIKLVAMTVWDGIKTAAETAWNGIKSFIEDPITAVSNALNTIWNGIKDAAVTAWEAVKGALEPIITPIRDLIQGIIDKVQSVINWFKQLMGWDNKHLSTTTSEHVHTETTVKRTVNYSDVRNGNVDLPAPTADDPFPGLTTGINGFNPFKMGGRAKGDWYVPYDTPSLLHRGEMVLTASQARRYRDGESGLDIAALASAIVGAVREGMAGAQVNSYIDGDLITDSVNRKLGESLDARRFA